MKRVQLARLALAACSALVACAVASRDNADPAATEDAGGLSDVGIMPPIDAPFATTDAAMDARVRDASALRDAGACGLCDRIWVCNNLAQLWSTEPDGRCVNQVNGTALRCDGTLDGTSARDVGTWSGDASEIALKFRDLNGGTRTYYCYPK
jgi:hypothetical protein